MASQTSSMFIRNRIYISPEEQERIGRAKILLAGAGVGSVIAECLLRIGFQNITLFDGDTVELSNLNRQNYTVNDIGKAKVEALKNRLNEINPLANIDIKNIFLTEENVREYIQGHQIAINAIDFTSNLPFVFDRICAEENIPVLHPYNLGWSASVILLTRDSDTLSQLQPDFQNFEKAVVEYIINFCKKYLDNGVDWLIDVLDRYVNEEVKQSPPQLSVGSYLAAALCTKIACNIVLEKPVRVFPEIYYCKF